MSDATSRPAPRLAELSRDVADAINELVEVARAVERGDLGDSLLDAAKRWPEPHATVAIVGEIGGGRSTLTSALAGRLDPPLLPLGPNLTIVRAGSPEQVTVHRANGEVVTGPLASPPIVGPGDSAEVVVASIAAGDELVLVDVPGVGLLDDPRRRLVDAIVETADAVILVSRADSPITGPEIDIIRRARQRAGAALVVVTHIDRQRGWRTIVEESAASLRAAAGTGAPLAVEAPLGFSGPLAADALAAERVGDREEADALLEESGLGPINAAIRAHITSRLRHVRLRALVALGTAIADELSGDAEAVAEADVDPQAALAEARSTSRRLRELSSTASTRVSDAFAGLRDALGVDVGREVAAVTEEIEASLEDARTIEPVLDLAEQLLEGARVRLDDRARTQIDLVVAGVLDSFDAEDARAPQPEHAAGDAGGADDERARLRTSRAKRVTASMRLRLVQATLSSTGGVAMLAVVGGGGGGLADSLRFGAMGAGMLVGGLGAAEGFRETKRQRTTQEARAKVRVVTEQWRAEYLARLREQLLKEQRNHETALRETFRRQIEEADAHVAALQASAAGRPAQKGRADAAGATERVAAVRRRLDELDRVLGA